ncbi:MAG: biotin--[acetyl-CoA-carboxylase] ligase [Clostridiales bacterium]|nr:biotin--[acetyl-CoA-carboxylase] ligase [Clostridiales bacterium]
MKAELLKILRESGDFISGQQLCDHFGVSRTAVWKVIRQLKEEGYEIEAVKNKGYRICEAPNVITAEELGSRLQTRWMGKNCIYLESVDSTNTYAKKLAEEGAPEGTLVVTDEQTGGKGRRGRSWVTHKGENVMMTLMLRPGIRPEHASRLTLLMAMAVARGIRSTTGLHAQIKWPNDVVVNGKKVCGILTEMNTEIDYINYVVVGTGINVNQEEFPEELRDRAGSLFLELGQKVSRAGLAAAVMMELEALYEIFVRTEDLSGLRGEYNELCVNCGKQIRVLEPGNEYTGTTEGINELGELVVLKENGEQVCVYAGEVSVRGLYGYV